MEIKCCLLEKQIGKTCGESPLCKGCLLNPLAESVTCFEVIRNMRPRKIDKDRK